VGETGLNFEHDCHEIHDTCFLKMKNKKSVVIIMPTLKSLSDEYRRQVGKDESLDECNQYFDQINENSK